MQTYNEAGDLHPPNLECKTGQMKINYRYVNDIANDEPTWSTSHDALQNATPEIRNEVITCLLDQFRQNLARKYTEELPIVYTTDELIRKSRALRARRAMGHY